MNGIPGCRKSEYVQSANPPIGIDQKRFLIYKITNLINDKIYIGQTTQPFAKRQRDHIKNCFKLHSQQAIHRAMRKYGVECFKFEEVCYCWSKEELNQTEISLIRALNSKHREVGYNMTDGGEGSFGISPSQATREKLRIANLGKKQSDATKEKKKFYRGENSPRWGHKNTPETNAKISQSAKLRIGDKNSFYGKKHTPETIIKIQEAHKNRRAIAHEKHNRINELYHSGCTWKDIMKKMNISESGVHYARKKVFNIEPMKL